MTKYKRKQIVKLMQDQKEGQERIEKTLEEQEGKQEQMNILIETQQEEQKESSKAMDENINPRSPDFFHRLCVRGANL